VNAARPLSDNAGPNEHAFVEQFNQMIESEPIPVA